MSNNFTVVKGSHQFAFGGHYLWTKSDRSPTPSVGSYTFTGPFTGNAMADFLAGRIGSHRQASRTGASSTQPFAGVFTQDSWKLKRVTLNYGVVWNPFMPMNFYDGDVYTFDRDASAGRAQHRDAQRASGVQLSRRPGLQGSRASSRTTRWDPRVGFAWDVAATGDRGPGRRRHGPRLHQQQLHLNTSSVSPFRLTVDLPPARAWTTHGRTTRAATRSRTPSIRTTRQFPAYASYMPLPPDLEPTKQYPWNAACSAR